MKTFFLNAVLLLVAATAFGGDAEVVLPIPGLPEASTPSEPLEAFLRRIVAAKNFPVPIPLHTPFDADPEARKAYCESYCSGYRIGVTGQQISGSIIRDLPYREAVIKGHNDGQLAGLSDHPIRVLSDGTISVDDDCIPLTRSDWRQVFESQVKINNGSLRWAIPTRIFCTKEYHSLPVPLGQAILSAPPSEVVAYLEQLLASQPDGARAKWLIATWITVANNLDGASYKGGLVGIISTSEATKLEPVYRFALPYPTR